MDDYPKVVTANQRALEAARRQGMIQIEVRALHHQAFARRRTGGLAACDPALAAIRLARRKAEASGDPLLLNGVLVDLGSVLSNCNQPALADQVQQEALRRLRETGAFGKMAPLLFNLGASRLTQGDLIGADRLMREALASCETHSGILCRERFLHPVGANRLHRGEIAEARRMLEEGSRLNLRIGNRSRVAEAQAYLPTLTAWSGDLAQGIRLQRELLAGWQRAGSPWGTAWGHSGLAILLAEAGRGREALGHARRAMALANQYQEATLDACSRASLALAELAAGDLAAADRESALALARLRPPHKPFCSFIVWSVRSQVLLETGQLDAAEPLITEGLDLARHGGSRPISPPKHGPRGSA
jgi:tetratricopeptide (TPR) repeat protein